MSRSWEVKPSLEVLGVEVSGLSMMWCCLGSSTGRGSRKDEVRMRLLSILLFIRCGR